MAEPIIYTKQAVSSLPTTLADLSTELTEEGYANVEADDSYREGLTSSISEYAIFQFSRYYNEPQQISITWKGQTTYPPSTQSVVLQVWNNYTNSWQTLASNNSASANTDFYLTAEILDNFDWYFVNMTGIFDSTVGIFENRPQAIFAGGYRISARVYQGP